MTVYPAFVVFLLAWLWVSLRDGDRGVAVVLAALPFGMFAAIEASGLSVLVAHLLAALTIGTFILRRLSGRLPPISLSPGGVFLIIFALYALFSATVLVRLFAGNFLVFPMSFDRTGVAVSIFFNSTMKPLAPSNSNIAQAGYIALATLFFLVVADVVRRRGPGIVHSGFAWAAGLNILLGALDLMALDDVLSIIRTADYTLNNLHTFLGMPRVIGGFSEASAFGPVSAALFGYFALSYLIGRRSRDAALALGNFIFAILAFSTTGFAALLISIVLIVLHARSILGSGLSRAFGHFMIITLAVCAFGLAVAIVATPVPDMISGVLTDLFVEKSQSSSGLERGAWARSGFAAFADTFGLGAGAGSLRANGLASVLLGSVGLPGTLAFLAFLWAAISPTGKFRSKDAQRSFCAARVAALTYFAAQMVSATTPDPTLILVSALALASVTRQNSYAPRTARHPRKELAGE